MSDLAGYEGQDGEKIRALIEDSHQLSELQAHPGWEVLMRYVREWLDLYETRLMNGHLEDMLEYKLTAGRVGAIRQILDLPRQVEKLLATAKEKATNPQSYVDEFVPDAFRQEYASATPTDE